MYNRKTIFKGYLTDHNITFISCVFRTVEGAGIRVVPVVFGREANKNELIKTTPEKQNVVEAEEDDKPENIAKKIINNAIAGEFFKWPISV